MFAYTFNYILTDFFRWVFRCWGTKFLIYEFNIFYIHSQITYGEADSAIASRITVVSVGTGTSYIITNLLANTLYTASVTASTIIGPGDSSQEVMEKTDFGGERHLIIIWGRLLVSDVLYRKCGTGIMECCGGIYPV